MQLQKFTYLLQHPETISETETNLLFSTIEQYSYFQPLYALYLKGLKQKNSYKYNNVLRKTAAHTTDRSILFDFITSEVFNQNDISKKIKQNYEYLKEIEVYVDDNNTENHIQIDTLPEDDLKHIQNVLDPNLFEEKITDNITAQVNVIGTLEDKLKIGQPLEFSTSESHSFTEWLKLTSFKPITREDTIPTDFLSIENKAPLEDKLAVIDRFIEENPKIKPVSNAPKPSLINSDDEGIPDSVMTETLARIYNFKFEISRKK